MATDTIELSREIIVGEKRDLNILLIINLRYNLTIKEKPSIKHPENSTIVNFDKKYIYTTYVLRDKRDEICCNEEFDFIYNRFKHHKKNR